MADVARDRTLQAADAVNEARNLVRCAEMACRDLTPQEGGAIGAVLACAWDRLDDARLALAPPEADRPPAP